MRKLIEGVLLGAVTLLVGAAAVAWTLRDAAGVGKNLPVKPPGAREAVRPVTEPIRVTSVKDLGQLSEDDLKVLEGTGDSTRQLDVDPEAFMADLERRLGAVSSHVREVDPSFTIPPARNRSGTASTGGSAYPGPEGGSQSNQ